MCTYDHMAIIHSERINYTKVKLKIFVFRTPEYLLFNKLEIAHTKYY